MAALAVAHFEELSGHFSNIWYHVEYQGPELPMSDTLVPRKPGSAPTAPKKRIGGRIFDFRGYFNDVPPSLLTL